MCSCCVFHNSAVLVVKSFLMFVVFVFCSFILGVLLSFFLFFFPSSVFYFEVSGCLSNFLFFLGCQVPPWYCQGLSLTPTISQFWVLFLCWRGMDFDPFVLSYEKLLIFRHSQFFVLVAILPCFLLLYYGFWHHTPCLGMVVSIPIF